MIEATPPRWDCHVHVFDPAAPALAGHYVPAFRPLLTIDRLARSHGFGHLVLVQPSVYGTDNQLMLQALRMSGGEHRGIAVVDALVSDRELNSMHALGVRGVRFNLVSPVAATADVPGTLRRLAPRLHERGWHVQWYVHADQLPALVPWQAETGLVFVLDHLAGLAADLPEAHPAWAAAQALAEAGAWIKLSGWYRLSDSAPYAALQAHLRRALALFGPRCVWGSDWPHTSFAPDAAPDYLSLLAPVLSALDEAGLAALLQAQPASLYAQPSQAVR